MKLNSLAFVVIPLLTFAVQADSVEPGHSCTKPNKPDEFNSQRELDSFNNDVQRYQSCLYDFVDQQQEAIQRHQRATKDAIDEWNNFVRMELK